MFCLIHESVTCKAFSCLLYKLDGSIIASINQFINVRTCSYTFILILSLSHSLLYSNNTPPQTLQLPWKNTPLAKSPQQKSSPYKVLSSYEPREKAEPFRSALGISTFNRLITANLHSTLRSPFACNTTQHNTTRYRIGDCAWEGGLHQYVK